jgi:hypothetical protein
LCAQGEKFDDMSGFEGGAGFPAMSGDDAKFEAGESRAACTGDA